MVFVGGVRPRRKDEEATCGYGIEEDVGGLEILAETVIGNVDNGVVLFEKDMEHLLLVLGNEGRDHDRAFAGGEDTTVLVIAEGLFVAVLLGVLYPDAADVEGSIMVVLEKSDITDGIVGAASDDDVGLHAEEAGLETPGGEALRVHLYIANHRLELTVRGHRANKRHLPPSFVSRNCIRVIFPIDTFDPLKESASDC